MVIGPQVYCESTDFIGPQVYCKSLTFSNHQRTFFNGIMHIIIIKIMLKVIYFYLFKFTSFLNLWKVFLCVPHYSKSVLKYLTQSWLKRVKNYSGIIMIKMDTFYSGCVSNLCGIPVQYFSSHVHKCLPYRWIHLLHIYFFFSCYRSIASRRI